MAARPPRSQILRYALPFPDTQDAQRPDSFLRAQAFGQYVSNQGLIPAPTAGPHELEDSRRGKPPSQMGFDMARQTARRHIACACRGLMLAMSFACGAGLEGNWTTLTKTAIACQAKQCLTTQQLSKTGKHNQTSAKASLFADSWASHLCTDMFFQGSPFVVIFIGTASTWAKEAMTLNAVATPTRFSELAILCHGLCPGAFLFCPFRCRHSHEAWEPHWNPAKHNCQCQTGSRPGPTKSCSTNERAHRIERPSDQSTAKQDRPETCW